MQGCLACILECENTLLSINSAFFYHQTSNKLVWVVWLRSKCWLFYQEKTIYWMLLCVAYKDTQKNSGVLPVLFGILVIQKYVIVVIGKKRSVLTLCLCHSLGVICCDGSGASFRDSSLLLIIQILEAGRVGSVWMIIQFSPGTESSWKLSLRQRSLCGQLPVLVRRVLQGPGTSFAAHIKAGVWEHKLANAARPL